MSNRFWSQWCRQLLGHVPRRSRERGSIDSVLVAERLETRTLLSVSVLGDTSAQYLPSDTLSAFTVEAGSNRVLVVSVGDPQSTDVTDVTFNGMAMTEATSRSDTIAVDEIWYLVLTDGAAITGDIVITSSGGTGKFISATAFQGVDPANPVEVGPTNQASGTNLSSSRTVTSEVGDMVYDTFDTYKASLPATISVGANQTELSNEAGQIAGAESARYGTSIEAGAPTVTMSWTSTAEAILHLTINLNGITSAAPVLANPGSITFTEGDAETVIASGITVQDSDSATLASATVTITNFVSGQDTLAFVNDGSTMGNIAVQSNASGVLTLTSAGSTATLAEWQAALRAVTYLNSSDAPDTTTRTVDFVVNDGTDDSNSLSSSITITAVNDAPVFVNYSSGRVPYIPGSGSEVNIANTVITGTPIIFDIDSGTFTGATVEILGYQAGDQLTMSQSSPGFNADFQNGVLTITGSGDRDTYDFLLKSVKYSSTSSNPALRTIQFTISDGTDTGSFSRDVGGYAQQTGPSTVTVFGTSDVDAMTVNEAAGTVTITVNGEVATFASGNVATLDIFGYAGSDRIEIQSLLGSSRSVTIKGGDGNDTIRVSSSVTNAVHIQGGNNNDLLIGGGGDDVIVGNAGNDWLNGGAGSDTLSGEAGNDCYAFDEATSSESDLLSELTGNGTDTLTFASMTSDVTIDLSASDALGSMANRTITVLTGQGDNFENVQGGAGADLITGNGANNLLAGNGNADQLTGMGGNDQLQGGGGDDGLTGGDGNDYLAGGDGNDTYIFKATLINQTDTLVERQAEGTDTLDFQSATAATVNLTSDTLTASFAHQIVTSVAGTAAQLEQVYGSSENDHITGNDKKNLISGGTGNDTLIGNGASDILLGGEGNDLIKGISGLNILVGGAGADLLIGGTGADILVTGNYTPAAANLGLILSEWSSANDYELRLAHIEGTISGGLNGGAYLDSTTIVNDVDKDYATGGGGVDWFLADSRQDVLTDLAIDEIFSKIDRFGNSAT